MHLKNFRAYEEDDIVQCQCCGQKREIHYFRTQDSPGEFLCDECAYGPSEEEVDQ